MTSLRLPRFLQFFTLSLPVWTEASASALHVSLPFPVTVKELATQDRRKIVLRRVFYNTIFKFALSSTFSLFLQISSLFSQILPTVTSC
jgi:hypothetical protein